MTSPSPSATGKGSLPTHDVIIVGAGVMGSALAVTFARQGRQVLLLERDLREPDRIVGEQLQAGGVAALRALGLNECLDGIDAIPIRAYRLLYFGQELTLWYPPVAEYPLWESISDDSTRQGGEPGNGKMHEGRSFHYGRFITKLRQVAMRETNVRLIQATVIGLIRSRGGNKVIGVTARSASQTEEHYFAPLTIVSDGQSSKLRPALTSRPSLITSRFWGLRLVDAEMDSYGTSLGIIGLGTAAGIYQIGARETRVLFDLPDNSAGHAKVAEFVRLHSIPVFPEGLKKAAIRALDAGELRSMPTYWLPPSDIKASGVALLGDAWNCRSPISGSGMTVALNDAVVLSCLLHPDTVPSFSDTNCLSTQMARFRKKRRKYSLPLNILAEIMHLITTAHGSRIPLPTNRLPSIHANCWQMSTGEYSSADS